MKFGSSQSPAAEFQQLEPRVLFNADFNHDGRTDLVWHNKSTEEVVIWEIENEGVESTINLPSVPAEWDIVGFGDFNRDGDDDILWRNNATGENVVWLMDSESIDRSVFLPSVAVNSGWEAQAVGDFNQDLRPDIVWRNYMTGENVVWVMNDDDSVDRSDSIPTIADATWHIVGAADFNDDLETDILWRNDDTGQTVVWLMDGHDLTGDHSLPTVFGSEWRISSVGNFTGNADEDILWRRLTDGANIVWRLEETNVTGDTVLPPLADGDWTIGGGDNRISGDDWNRDGVEDLLWLDPGNGRGLLWYMSTTGVTSTNNINNLGQQVRGLVAVEDFDNERGVDFLQHNQDTGAVTITLRVAGTSNFREARRGELVEISLPAVVDTSWQVAGAADFNGDESADILWRNAITGENVVWLLNRGNFSGVLHLPSAPVEWDIQGVRTGDAADTADIVWRNLESGHDVIWTMTGESISAVRFLDTEPVQSRQIVGAIDLDRNGFTDVLWLNTTTDGVEIWLYDANGRTSLQLDDAFTDDARIVG